MITPSELQYIDIVDLAIKEDYGRGDITSECLPFENVAGRARIVAKEDAVIAGLFVAATVFKRIDPSIAFQPLVEEGALARKGDLLATATGPAASLLAAERTALNFLQRLSGVATFTYKYVRSVKGTSATIVDTRKTTPGMRLLEKYAVRAGGGKNHRFALGDAVLLKDNHIDLAGGIRPAVAAAKAYVGHTIKIEVETRTLAEVADALDAGADIIMLDNMGFDLLEQSIKLIDHRAIVEVSGGITLLTVTDIAALGVDIISVGEITHSHDSTDISMYIETEK